LRRTCDRFASETTRIFKQLNPSPNAQLQCCIVIRHIAENTRHKIPG
jgi:hypothetical protein